MFIMYRQRGPIPNDSFAPTIKLEQQKYILEFFSDLTLKIDS